MIFATPAARRAYVVVGSESARALAATVELHDSSSGARGALSLPPFAEGLWWVLASASPGAVESASPASFGEPLLIGHAPLTLAELARAPLPDGCAVAERIATARRPRYTMSLLVDGFASKQADDAQRRRLGLTLALARLFVGAVLEGALVMLGARESRAALARLSAELDDEAALEPPPRLAALRVVIALLLVTLGFLLFAAMAGAWG